MLFFLSDLALATQESGAHVRERIQDPPYAYDRFFLGSRRDLEFQPVLFLPVLPHRLGITGLQQANV